MKHLSLATAALAFTLAAGTLPALAADTAATSPPPSAAAQSPADQGDPSAPAKSMMSMMGGMASGASSAPGGMMGSTPGSDMMSVNMMDGGMMDGGMMAGGMMRHMMNGGMMDAGMMRRMMGSGMMSMMNACDATGREDRRTAAENWFLSALLRADKAKLAAALVRLDADPEAKTLMATPEAATLRRIVETGKLPDVTLEEFHAFTQSSTTHRLVRALNQVLRIQRTLSQP